MATERPLPQLPLLAGLYHVVPLGPNRVEIVNAGRSIALSGENFVEKVMPLLNLLDGATSFDDIKKGFPDLAVPVVTALVQRGMVTDASPEPDTARSAPTSAAMAFLDSVSAVEAVERLRSARVLISGCGPVGAQVAIFLAKAGVGTLLLSDDDRISAGDIATSLVFSPEAEGQPRAKTAMQLCSSVSDSIVDTVEAPLSDKDLAAITFGVMEIGYYPDESETISDQLLKSGIPYFPYSQDALEAVIGPLVAPGGEPCHRCLEARRQSHLAHLDEYLAYRKHRSEQKPTADAFTAAHTGTAAGAIASETLRAIIDATPQKRHTATIYDFARLSVEKEEVFLIPTCPACEGAGRWASGKEVTLTIAAPS